MRKQQVNKQPKEQAKQINQIQTAKIKIQNKIYQSKYP